MCLGENTMTTCINAVKFYFEHVMKREQFFFEIPQPKKIYPAQGDLCERHGKTVLGSP